MNAQADRSGIAAVTALTGGANMNPQLLPVPERARALLKSEKTEADFKALLEQSKSITAITNADGYKQCHAARMALVRARTTLDALDEEVREDLVATNKAIIAERKRLTEIIQPEEKRLESIQKEYDAKIAAEKKAKAEAEAKRVALIQERIEEIRGAAMNAVGKSVADIEASITAVESIAIDESFAELKPQAEGAKATTLVRLRTMREAEQKAQDERKRLEEERAAAAIERERLAREKAEQEAIAAKERARLAEEERQAKLKRDAEERAHKEQLRKQRQEEERAAAERRRILAEEEAAAEARIAAQKAEADAAAARQREAQQAEAKRLADERAALERDQETQRIAAEQAAIAAAQPTPAVSPEPSNEAPSPEPAGPQANTTTYVPWGTSPTGLVIHGVVDTSTEATAAQPPQARWRPKDEAILHLVAITYQVTHDVARGWLVDMVSRLHENP